MVRAEWSGCIARRRRFAVVSARDGLGGRRFGGSRERCEDAAHSGLFSEALPVPCHCGPPFP
ncbi:hypothetical protein WCP94_000105 (plasmid) [Bilophila wadsworthia]